MIKFYINKIFFYYQWQRVCTNHRYALSFSIISSHYLDKHGLSYLKISILYRIIKFFYLSLLYICVINLFNKIFGVIYYSILIENKISIFYLKELRINNWIIIIVVKGHNSYNEGAINIDYCKKGKIQYLIKHSLLIKLLLLFIYI